MRNAKRVLTLPGHRRDHPFATRKGHSVFGLIATLSPPESTISILDSLDETQLEFDLIHT